MALRALAREVYSPEDCEAISYLLGVHEVLFQHQRFATPQLVTRKVFLEWLQRNWIQTTTDEKRKILLDGFRNELNNQLLAEALEARLKVYVRYVLS